MPTRARNLVLTDSDRRWLRWIGGWQMVGGAFSAVVLLDNFGRYRNVSEAAVLILGAVTVLSLLAALAGFALYQHRAPGVMPSLVLQLLQIVGIATNSMWLQFVLGPSVALNLVWGQGIQLQAAFRPTFQFHFASSVPLNAGVSINLLALFCFMKLLFIKSVPIVSTDSPDVDVPGPEVAA